MTRGGARKGAGRPRGGKYNEPTKVVRLPLSVIESLQRMVKIPLYLSKVPAGFPSPADDYIADHLDLNEYLIKHPSATFLVRATGNSMINAGIHENDILVVDRSLNPAPGKIVIVAIDGQLTVKRWGVQGKHYLLLPDNPDYEPINLSEHQDIIVWGVVTNVIHAV